MENEADPGSPSATPVTPARPKRSYVRRAQARRVAPRTPERREEAAAPTVARSTPVRSTDVRERKRKGDSTIDMFAIPRELIPDGLSLEWKRESAAGMEDPHYMVGLYEQGWRPVDAALIPGIMPADYKGPIRMKGQILMERPIALTKEAEAENLQNARRAVAAKERQLHGVTQGVLSQGDRSPNTGALARRTYEAGIPVG